MFALLKFRGFLTREINVSRRENFMLYGRYFIQYPRQLESCIGFFIKFVFAFYLYFLFSTSIFQIVGSVAETNMELTFVLARERFE